MSGNQGLWSKSACAVITTAGISRTACGDRNASACDNDNFLALVQGA
jgi:hypothetical protein